MESIAMGISNQNISSIRDVDTIWIVCKILASYAAQVHSFFTEHNHIVTLEVTYIELIAWKRKYYE